MKIALQSKITNYLYAGYRPDDVCGVNFLSEYSQNMNSFSSTQCLQKICKKIFKERYYFPSHFDIRIIPVDSEQYLIQFSGHSILIKQGVLINEKTP